MEEVTNLGVIQSERIQSLLFAVLEAKRFHEERQTRERLSVSADICWYIISDYRNRPYRCITNHN